MRKYLGLFLTLAFGLSIVFLACEKGGNGTENIPPTISPITANKTVVNPGGKIICSVSVSDEDENDQLNVTWTDNANGQGAFNPNFGTQTEWTAPSTVGTYVITATVSDGTDNAYSTITITVEASGAISVSSKLLDFGSSETQKTFTVTNVGSAALHFTAMSSDGWISYSPDSENLNANQSLDISVTVNRNDREKNTDLQGKIIVTANAISETVIVKMQVITQFKTDPTSLDFGQLDSEKTLILSNDGDGVVNWNLELESEWLTVTPAAGNINNHSNSQVTVRANRDNLANGSWQDTIIFNGGVAGSLMVIATIQIVTPGQIMVSPTELYFGEGTDYLDVQVTNGGVNSFNWEALPVQDWITVAPTTGSTTRETDVVRVTVNRLMMPNLGENIGTILFDAGDAGQVYVDVTAMKSSNNPILQVGATSLDFGADLDELTLQISNAGEAGSDSLSYQITTSETWLTCVPTRGKLAAGRNRNLSVSVNRAGLDEGEYDATLNITSNGGDIAVDVTMRTMGGGDLPQDQGNVATGRAPELASWLLLTDETEVDEGDDEVCISTASGNLGGIALPFLDQNSQPTARLLDGWRMRFVGRFQSTPDQDGGVMGILLLIPDVPMGTQGGQSYTEIDFLLFYNDQNATCLAWDNNSRQYYRFGDAVNTTISNSSWEIIEISASRGNNASNYTFTHNEKVIGTYAFANANAGGTIGLFVQYLAIASVSPSCWWGIDIFTNDRVFKASPINPLQNMIPYPFMPDLEYHNFSPNHNITIESDKLINFKR